MNETEDRHVQPVGEVESQLRDKIKSKMDIGKFFSGFVALFLGFMLTGGTSNSGLGILGVILLIGSLALMVASMFAYDSLLMPRAFWTASRTEGMSAMQFQRYLKRQMFRAWRGLFIPGVGFFAVGLLLTMASRLPPGPDDTFGLDPWAWLGVLVVIGFLVPIAQFVRKKPGVYE